MTEKHNLSDSVQDFLAESDKLIKASERNLKKLEAMRKQLGLNAGASRELMDAIPESSEERQKAEQDLESFLAENGLGADVPPKPKKKKRRDKLNKVMRNNIRP